MNAFKFRAMVAVVLALFLCRVSAGWGLATLHTPARQAAIEPNVTFSLNLAKIQHEIEKVETLPTCKKVASKNLLHSCQSYNGHTDRSHSTPAALEMFQKVFAVRMTNCELLDANQEMPDVCRPLIEIDFGTFVPEHLLKTCLDGLYDGNNHWTTYMNIKTQGLVMCHTIRVEADKDESIQLQKDLVEISRGLGNILDLTQIDYENMMLSFRNNSKVMQKFYSELHQDNEEIRSAVKETMTTLSSEVQHVDAQVQSLAGTVSAAKNELEEHTASIALAVDQSASSSAEAFAKLSTVIAITLDEVHQAREQFSFEGQQMLEAVQNNAHAASQSLDVANDHANGLQARLGGIVSFLDAAGASLGMVQARADHILSAQQASMETIVKMNAISEDTIESIRFINSKVALANRAVTWASDWIFGPGFFRRMGCFIGWTATIFFALVSIFWWCCGMPLTLTGIISCVLSLYLGTMFAFVMSPTFFVQSVVKAHPEFLAPAPWSILAVGVFWIGLTVAVIAVWSKMKKTREQRVPLLGEREMMWGEKY